jgi:DNA-binding NarL/FixJ family response regulator
MGGSTTSTSRIDEAWRAQVHVRYSLHFHSDSHDDREAARPDEPSGHPALHAPAPNLTDEARAITATTGTTGLICTSLVLAAWRGQESRALELIEASLEDATPQHERLARLQAEYGRAVLYNGFGRYDVAYAAARRACEDDRYGVVDWALPELVEAGVRSGRLDTAAAALARFEERTCEWRTDWALGIEARSRALVETDSDTDGLYREALDRLASAGVAPHLARAQLLYGEWLRRAGRRVDAREQLRAAQATFTRIGAQGFGERTRRELAATGETVRKRSEDTRDELTPQESQIARLAAEGHTNPEIGAQLFLSPRTVEWHLRKVFMKLGIRSRRELRTSLTPSPDQGVA